MATGPASGPEESRSFSLEALELKALCVPHTLAFLLSIEKDVSACTAAGLKFPKFTATYRRLVELCACRFGLEVRESETHLEVAGEPTRPLLLYADFFPGGVTSAQIFAALGVAKPASLQDGEASYGEFLGEQPADMPHGTGYYMTLDLGLPLATHTHLVHFQLTDDSVATDAGLRTLRQLLGVKEANVVYTNAKERRTGVVLMPSVHDAADIFDRYEDEESEDELEFRLRPVAQHVTVPYMDDAHMKKLRAQHWPKVVERMKGGTCSVTVSNFHEKCTLDDITKIFEDCKVSESALFTEGCRTKRRKVVISFASLDSVREALDHDGKNMHGRALRVQVSPPTTKASPKVGATPNSSAKKLTGTPMNIAAKEFVPGAWLQSNNESFGLPPPQRSPAADAAASPPAPPPYIPPSPNPPTYDEYVQTPPLYGVAPPVYPGPPPFVDSATDETYTSLPPAYDNAPQPPGYHPPPPYTLADS